MMIYRKCNQYAWRRRLPALERQYEDSWIDITLKSMLHEYVQKYSFATDDEADKMFNQLFTEKSSLWDTLSKD